MGLDITAYKNLKVVENPLIDEDGYPVNWETEWTPSSSMEWSESVWAGRGEGVESHKVYTYEDEFDFRAGSYGGYNWWRSKLEEFAQDGIQFHELIEFADNEGVIGSVVSKKLVKEFKENKVRAEEFSKSFSDGEFWFNKYCLWEKAFEMASENGAVDFH